MWVRSLGWEYPLEEGIATHSSVVAWRVSRIEEPGGLQSMESNRVKHDTRDLACILIFQNQNVLLQFSEVIQILIILSCQQHKQQKHCRNFSYFQNLDYISQTSIHIKTHKSFFRQIVSLCGSKNKIAIARSELLQKHNILELRDASKNVDQLLSYT